MNSLSFRIHITCPMFNSNDNLQARSKKILLALFLLVPLLGLFIWIGQTHVEDKITIMQVYTTLCSEFYFNSISLHKIDIHFCTVPHCNFIFCSQTDPNRNRTDNKNKGTPQGAPKTKYNITV